MGEIKNPERILAERRGKNTSGRAAERADISWTEVIILGVLATIGMLICAVI